VATPCELTETKQRLELSKWRFHKNMLLQRMFLINILFTNLH